MNSSVDYSSTDRFIPLRRSNSECFQVCRSFPNPSCISCVDYSKNYRTNDSRQNYMQQLYKTNQYNNMLIEKIFNNPRKVLYFSPKQKANKNAVSSSEECGESWPVTARKKPLITSPDLILDLPDLGVNVGIGSNQKVDWGATGYIAAIHRNSIHTHNPDTNTRILIKSDEVLGECIKWNKDGTRLAIALQNRMIGIWDIVSERMIQNSSWQTPFGKITSMVYTSRLLITGHSHGRLIQWTHNLEEVIKIEYAHSEAIVTMKASCNESFLATAAIDGYVKIWNLPRMNEVYRVTCRPHKIIRSLDWHPWKEPILIIGKSNTASFCTMWNVNQPIDVIVDEHPNHPIVDCLKFNPLSAELVISFWLSRPDESQNCQNIVVQSGLNTIVDDINFHTTRTPYLLWDKNGSRLASVGADENLAIWDFFGQENKKKNKFNLFPKNKSIFDATIR